MTDGMHTKRRLPWPILLLAVLTVSVATAVHGQDRLPDTCPTGLPSLSPPEVDPHREPSMLIPYHYTLSPQFQGCVDNHLLDPSHSMAPFFEKLRTRRNPVRIVHIGDSHVRGHVLPLVVRRHLERDFGNQAVYPDTITYQTSGLARETGRPGVVYHMIGINGATCHSFANASQVEEIPSLHPDLIILSFGTNESHGAYNPVRHMAQMDELITRLRNECPKACILLTTPPGSYIRYRKKRSINTRTPLVAQTIVAYANRHGYAAWDLFNTVGGEHNACRNWTNGGYMVRDRIHYTSEGYTLQGNLLYDALIKAYNEYVSI